MSYLPLFYGVYHLKNTSNEIELLTMEWVVEEEVVVPSQCFPFIIKGASQQLLIEKKKLKMHSLHS